MVSSSQAWFVHTLGAHELTSKKTMTTFVGCVAFDKKKYINFKRMIAAYIARRSNLGKTTVPKTP